MRKLLAALLFALLPAVAAAQSYPQFNLPASSVVGRLGNGSGPAQPIPFSTFLSAIQQPCSTGAVGLVPATGGGTSNFLRADCTFATPPNPTISNNQILANTSGSSGAATGTNPTSLWDSFCSSSVGQFWVRLSSAWGCTALGYANPVWWGADTTGTSDSATAFNSAIATGLPVRLPGHSTFKINSLITVNLANAAVCFCMEGGGSNSTVLNWPNASGGILINAASIMNNVRITGVHLTTTQTNSGTAISMQGVGSNSAPWSFIDDVLITGDDFTGSAGSHYWALGFNLFNWGDINVYRTNFYGPINSTGGGVGLEYGGKAASTSYATILNIYASSFNFANPGISLQNYWQGVSIYNINCNGASGGPCVQQSGSATGTLSLLYITGSQMNTKGNQIDINTAIDDVAIVNNPGITCTTNNCVAVNLGASLGSAIEGNYIYSIGSPTGTTGILSSGSFGVASGNNFQNLANGINLAVGSASWVAALNAWNTVTTKITNNGTGNSVGTAVAGSMTGVVP